MHTYCFIISPSLLFAEHCTGLTQCQLEVGRLCDNQLLFTGTTNITNIRIVYTTCFDYCLYYNCWLLCYFVLFVCFVVVVFPTYFHVRSLCYIQNVNVYNILFILCHLLSSAGSYRTNDQMYLAISGIANIYIVNIHIVMDLAVVRCYLYIKQVTVIVCDACLNYCCSTSVRAG